MSLDLERIAALNNDLHFCEDLAVSGPIDAGVPVGDGPLAGRVIGLKSNIRVAGQAWTAGIGTRAAQVADDDDAAVVTPLRAAGATILSRLMMDEGALGAATDNPHFGRCENPAWPGHSAGGSSGGSAAAVAAGAVDAAFGSDTLGSVRIPAAYCGVYGLKLGHGAVSMGGVFPLAPDLDALGIFARDLSVLSDVLQVVLPDSAAPAPIAGWYATTPDMLTGCAPKVLDFYATCCVALGQVMPPLRAMPPLNLAGLRADAFLMTEVAAVNTLGSEPGLSRGLKRLIDYGRKVDVRRQHQTQGRLAEAAHAVRQSLGANRVLVLPTVADSAFQHGTPPPAGQADFTALANIAGCPALAIPKPGAVPPVSVQIVGPKGSEHRLIALAQDIAARI